MSNLRALFRNDLESTNKRLDHEEKEQLSSHQWQTFDTHSHIPNQILLMIISLTHRHKELTKERLRVVANFRVLFLAQVVKVSSLRVINILDE